MPGDERDTGIPTRAIHEAYLNLQESHRQYRRARDNPNQPERRAHAGFQDAVLGFYELIRPHLKRKSSMAKFWEGRLPDYPGRDFASVEQARRYYQNNGIAVWSLQKHIGKRQARQAGAGSEAIADGGGVSFSDLHDTLGFTDRQRLVSIEREDGILLWIELRAVAGLGQLDGWETREETHREKGSGFMASQTKANTELRHVPIGRLTRAKRLLAEAADKMSLLSRVEIDHEDGAIVNFDQSRDDVEPEYRDAEYDNSPDI